MNTKNLNPEITLALKSGAAISTVDGETVLTITAANLQLFASRVRIAELDRRSIRAAIAGLREAIRWVDQDAIPETIATVSDHMKHCLKMLTAGHTSQPNTFEHDIAILESTRNRILDAYFDARPALDTPAHRRIADAAFARGWAAQRERDDL